MRLLRTTDLTLVEFYEAVVPPYAILSHKWTSTDQEVSYTEFKEESKISSTGYAKIKKFCEIIHQQDELEYCWVDTCCIDKNSSAELTEAINSMFHWYEKAVVCYAYLSDIDDVDYLSSSWFTRGWTLQELLAPSKVLFVDSSWRLLGTKYGLAKDIATVTGIGQALLCGRASLQDYSVAQKMSWASKRQTTRKEDQAYCLLGLFDVNMPLLYGEGPKAFRRLQEEILASGEDNSLFAWDYSDLSHYSHCRADSILAPSPANFLWSSNIRRGFASHRVLFEKTSKGLMILIHRSYDPDALGHLLQMARDMRRLDRKSPLGLTLPLGCYRTLHDDVRHIASKEDIFLHLMLDGGKWRRIGINSYHDPESTTQFKGAHYAAYTNDYVRLYVHHDMAGPESPTRRAGSSFDDKTVRFVDIRDKFT